VRVPGSKELFRENLGKEMKVLAGPLIFIITLINVYHYILPKNIKFK